MENYECTINYHPGKANVVADALSRKTQVDSLMVKEWNLLVKISEWNPRFERLKIIFENITVRLTLLDRIKEAQAKEPMVQKWVKKVQKGEIPDFKIGPEGILNFRDWLVIPKDAVLKRKILKEAHRSKYTIHPESNKMYHELKILYWWDNMKREIA